MRLPYARSAAYPPSPWSAWCEITRTFSCVQLSWLLQFTLVWYRWHWPPKASRMFKIDWPAWWQSSLFPRSVPLLRSRYWLPVRLRILFQIYLLTYKTLREKQPAYLHSMLTESFPSRSLRSSKGNSLSVPRVKTNTGARACHFCH